MSSQFLSPSPVSNSSLAFHKNASLAVSPPPDSSGGIAAMGVLSASLSIMAQQGSAPDLSMIAGVQRGMLVKLRAGQLQMLTALQRAELAEAMQIAAKQLEAAVAKFKAAMTQGITGIIGGVLQLLVSVTAIKQNLLDSLKKFPKEVADRVKRVVDEAFHGFTNGLRRFLNIVAHRPNIPRTLSVESTGGLTEYLASKASASASTRGIKGSTDFQKIQAEQVDDKLGEAKKALDVADKAERKAQGDWQAKKDDPKLGKAYDEAIRVKREASAECERLERLEAAGVRWKETCDAAGSVDAQWVEPAAQACEAAEHAFMAEKYAGMAERAAANAAKAKTAAEAKRFSDEAGRCAATSERFTRDAAEVGRKAIEKLAPHDGKVADTPPQGMKGKVEEVLLKAHEAAHNAAGARAAAEEAYQMRLNHEQQKDMVVGQVLAQAAQGLGYMLNGLGSTIAAAFTQLSDEIEAEITRRQAVKQAAEYQTAMMQHVVDGTSDSIANLTQTQISFIDSKKEEMGRIYA